MLTEAGFDVSSADDPVHALRGPFARIPRRGEHHLIGQHLALAPLRRLTRARGSAPSARWWGVQSASRRWARVVA